VATIEVRPATETDRQVVIDVITLAFSTDPMARWSFPVAATYLAVMPEMIAAFGDSGFAQGSVHLVEGGSAAAMWLPPGVDPDSDRLAALAGQHAPPHQRDDMTKVFEQMASYHPDEPCWYLPVIGVDPMHQGRGHGAALLRYALERCDRDGVPAYLESSNPRNVPLYERHGFVAMGSIQAGSSPTVIPMLRRPSAVRR
jgi:GNAT superfamily N-acetyltransferase